MIDDEATWRRLGESLARARGELLAQINRLPQAELPHGPARSRLVHIALGLGAAGVWARVYEDDEAGGGVYAWYIELSRAGVWAPGWRRMTPAQFARHVEQEEADNGHAGVLAGVVSVPQGADRGTHRGRRDRRAGRIAAQDAGNGLPGQRRAAGNRGGRASAGRRAESGRR